MRMVFVAMAVAIACGGREDGSGSFADPGTNTVADLSTDLRRAHQGPRAVVDYARSAVEFAAQVVAAASSASGALRRTGTVRETAGGVTYDAMPFDRLIAERRDGQRFELSIVEIDGSGEDAASFLRGGHRIRVRFLRGFELEGEAWSMREGRMRAGGIEGRLDLEGTSWSVDLELRGAESFDVDSTGSRFFDDHDLGGQMQADRIQIDVDEHWTFEIVTARDVGSAMTAASSIVRTINDAGSIGAERFEWENVRMQRAFRDGKPNELDTFWRASGEIAINGIPIGRVEKFATAIGASGGFVGFQLVTDAGAIELERYPAY